MKKFLITAALFCSIGIYAQTNVQLMYGSNNTISSTIERFKPDKNGSTFFFVDMFYDQSGPNEAYVEFARELKFWDGPFSAHVEYNGGLHADANMDFQISNAYLLGGTYSWNAPDFSKGFSLSAMYKNIQGNSSPHNVQLTGVWYMNMMQGKLSFTGFADFWTENHTVFGDNGPATAGTVFYTQPQLWYNFNKTLSAGGEVRIGANFGASQGLDVIFCPGIKVNL